MTFKELLRFTYGLVMGTSTPFLKPSKRFLFPVHRHEVDAHFGLFLGGSGICGLLEGNGEALVINTNQGSGATAFRKWVDEKAGRGAETVILNSASGDFSRGLALFADARKILAGPQASQFLGSDFGDLSGRVETVERETKLQVAGENVLLIPVGPAATASDLVVYLEKHSTLFLGPLFYNRVHPILRAHEGLDVAGWIAKLESLTERFREVETFVPAEGDVANHDDVLEFIGYLRDLSNPEIEFAECRQRYDWPEIPSMTSLEENFDLLREKKRSHTTLN